MVNQSKNEKKCPFWNRTGKRECRLVENGLFIPTGEHILRFCETEFYGDCYHYVGKMAPQEKTGEKSSGSPQENRRAYTRIPVQEKLLVARYSLLKEADEDVIDDRALALDLSLGGMRLETREPVSVNQVLSFTFDDGFTPPCFKGKGEVRWITESRSPGGSVSAGVAFIDDTTKETIKNHLLGMGERLLHLS